VDGKIAASVASKKQAPKWDTAIALAPVVRNPHALKKKTTSLSKQSYAVAKIRSAG
jgi:hypothetical protein